jgi:hypothetical protein
MNTILYRIPNKYFPGVFVKKPFHAKVNYEVKDTVVKVYDICLSPLCLTHIRDTDKMITEMNDAITEAERKRKAVGSINQTIAGALVPHM